ncbi:unnamed protein product [Miscanthus lutarioriparius]|uniref:Uncharacterized protein n=1 Tax=Miscanthus lutarioriparius TaxID=422564 RepID=A0A811P866_9POAL|nr:unnamed protein product [Miscanthus lutarioriparius]
MAAAATTFSTSCLPEVVSSCALWRSTPRLYVHGLSCFLELRLETESLTFLTLKQPLSSVMFPILKYSEKHSRNLILIAVFTLCCILCIVGYASTTVNVYMRFLISIINSAL